MSDTNSLRRKANALYLAVPESVADDVIPDIRQAADAIDALTAEVDVLTRALRQACSDGWADGEGAMARYIEQAELAGGAR